jgi:hypothetical protein
MTEFQKAVPSLYTFDSIESYLEYLWTEVWQIEDPFDFPEADQMLRNSLMGYLTAAQNEMRAVALDVNSIDDEPTRTAVTNFLNADFSQLDTLTLSQRYVEYYDLLSNNFNTLNAPSEIGVDFSTLGGYAEGYIYLNDTETGNVSSINPFDPDQATNDWLKDTFTGKYSYLHADDMGDGDQFDPVAAEASFRYALLVSLFALSHYVSLQETNPNVPQTLDEYIAAFEDVPIESIAEHGLELSTVAYSKMQEGDLPTLYFSEELQTYVPTEGPYANVNYQAAGTIDPLIFDTAELSYGYLASRELDAARQRIANWNSDREKELLDQLNAEIFKMPTEDVWGIKTLPVRVAFTNFHSHMQRHYEHMLADQAFIRQYEEARAEKLYEQESGLPWWLELGLTAVSDTADIFLSAVDLLNTGDPINLVSILPGVSRGMVQRGARWIARRTDEARLLHKFGASARLGDRALIAFDDVVQSIGMRFRRIKGKTHYKPNRSLGNALGREEPTFYFFGPDQDIREMFITWTREVKGRTPDQITIQDFEEFSLSAVWGVRIDGYTHSMFGIPYVTEVGAIFNRNGELIMARSGSIDWRTGNPGVNLPPELTRDNIVTHVHPLSREPLDYRNFFSTNDIRSHVQEGVFETRAVNSFNTVSINNITVTSVGSEKLILGGGDNNNLYNLIAKRTEQGHQEIIQNGIYGVDVTVDEIFTYKVKIPGEDEAETRIARVTFTIRVDQRVQ